MNAPLFSLLKTDTLCWELETLLTSDIHCRRYKMAAAVSFPRQISIESSSFSQRITLLQNIHQHYER